MPVGENGSIVDQNVGCAEPADNKITQAQDGCLLGYIQLAVQDFSAAVVQAFHGGQPFGFCAAGQDYTTIQPGQLATNFKADARFAPVTMAVRIDVIEVNRTSDHFDIFRQTRLAARRYARTGWFRLF